MTTTLHRHQGLHLGDDVYIRVVRITPTRVELAIDCPRAMPVVRGEVRLPASPRKAAADPDRAAS